MMIFIPCVKPIWLLRTWLHVNSSDSATLPRSHRPTQFEKCSWARVLLALCRKLLSLDRSEIPYSYIHPSLTYSSTESACCAYGELNWLYLIYSLSRFIWSDLVLPWYIFLLHRENLSETFLLVSEQEVKTVFFASSEPCVHLGSTHHTSLTA